MNTFATSPTMALAVAHYTIDQRVAESEMRARAREIRTQLKAERRGQRTRSWKPLRSVRVRVPARTALHPAQ